MLFATDGLTMNSVILTQNKADIRINQFNREIIKVQTDDGDTVSQLSFENCLENY